MRRLLRSRSPSSRSRASDRALGAIVAFVLTAVGSTVAQQTGSGVLPIASGMGAGGAFTSPITGPVGNCTTAPAYSLTGDTNTGMSSPSADALCFPVGGTSFWNLSTTANASTLPVAITQGTITASNPLLNMTSTWNNGAVAFTGIKLNVTLTASDAASLLMDLQTDATTRFRVTRAGDIVAGSMTAATAGQSVTGYALFAPSAAGGFRLVNTFAIATAPTYGSGFGTSPSVVASNGTVAFTVNVGTGGTATAGVITMPAAATGWICHVENQTGTLGNYANQRTVQIATTTTSITLENQTISTGAVLAWTASDVLVVSCAGY